MSYIVDNGNLVFDDDFKFKKIGGHNFVELLGMNPYSKVGDTLLRMFKVIKSDIDAKWLLRGDFAEGIVRGVYERDGHRTVVYDKKKCNYTNFPKSSEITGLIDIELPDEKTLIEVKSKSMKDYDKIMNEPPKSEIYQGLLYGYMRNYKYITMEWIFFDEETEKEVFAGQKPTTLRNLKRISRAYEVDRIEIAKMISRAVAIENRFLECKYIPLSLISEGIQKDLGIDTKNLVNIDDLPF